MGRPKGTIISEESRKKMSETNKRLGLKPPSWLGKNHTEETKKKISDGNKGKVFSEEHKLNIKKNHKGNTGRKFTLEHRVNLSKSHKELVAMGTHPSWKGGITPINKAIRTSLEYRLLREACFKRDNYTCLWCKQRGGRLQADHIKPFAYFPELRFALDNLRTLCEECHKTTDTYANNYKKIFNKNG